MEFTNGRSTRNLFVKYLYLTRVKKENMVEEWLQSWIQQRNYLNHLSLPYLLWSDFTITIGAAFLNTKWKVANKWKLKESSVKGNMIMLPVNEKVKWKVGGLNEKYMKGAYMWKVSWKVRERLQNNSYHLHTKTYQNASSRSNLPFLLRSRCCRLSRLAMAGGITVISLSDNVNFLRPWQ